MRTFNLFSSPVYRHLFKTRNELFFERKRESENTIAVSIDERTWLLVRQLIIDGLDLDKNHPDLKSKLQAVLDEFQRVGLYRNNIMRVGLRNAFYEYLLTCPGAIDMPIYYWQIYEVVKKLTGIDFREVEKPEITGTEVNEFLYDLVEREFNKLLEENDLPVLYDIEITN